MKYRSRSEVAPWNKFKDSLIRWNTGQGLEVAPWNKFKDSLIRWNTEVEIDY